MNIVNAYPPISSSSSSDDNDSLFNVVKRSLFDLQMNCEQSGFILIVFGGNLSDICNVYSPLIQTIKHVIENTDESNTLIVLTGSCTDGHGGDDSSNDRKEFVEIGEGVGGKQTNDLVPLYVKGIYRLIHIQCLICSPGLSSK